MLERGEIWLAKLNPRRGTEPDKSRPVFVIQAQALLDAGYPSTRVIPLTTSLVDEAEPLRIRGSARGRLGRDSDLLIDQLRAIDNKRLLEGPLTRLDSDSMRSIEHALLEVLDLSAALEAGEA